MENKDKLTCEECEVKFKSPELYEDHKLKTHGEQEAEEENGVPKEIREMFENPILIPCGLCKIDIDLDQFCSHEELHYNYNEDRETVIPPWDGSANTKITEIEMKELSHLCLHCKQRFPSSFHLMEHLGKTEEDFSEIFGCVFCSVHFNTKTQLLKHHGLHFDSGLNNLSICNVCQMSFVSFDFLVHHKITTHLSEKVLPKCKQCKEPFLSLAAIDCHQATSETCHLQRRLFACSLCPDIQFVHPYDLEKHKIEQHKTVSKLVPVKISESPNKSLVKLPPSSKMKGYTPIKSEVDLNYCCFLCSTRFSSGKGLMDHLNWVGRADKEMLLNCGICNSYFESMASLSEHKSTMHRNGCEQFHCDFCRSIFCESYLLEQHIIRKHTTAKVECIECQLKFFTKQELKCHVIKNYLCQFTDDMCCQVCEINFLYRSSFRVHYEFDHKNNGRFLCVCQKSFKSVELLDAHMRSVVCTKCEACFCEESWKQHKLKDCDTPALAPNSRKRPRIVDDSDAEESSQDSANKNDSKKSDKSNLDVSKESVKTQETKEKEKKESIAYVCKICKKAFRAKDFLKKHIATKHPDYKKEEAPEETPKS